MGVADERHLSLRGKLHLTLRLPLRERRGRDERVLLLTGGSANAVLWEFVFLPHRDGPIEDDTLSVCGEGRAAGAG
jgi:hypothetical protein